jgi:predicted nucleic acid-binding protein
VALIDAGETDHDLCRGALGDLSGPMLITWPVFTEAMYLLGDAGGWKAQNALWTLLTRGDMEIIELAGETVDRSRSLMQKYSDTPMSLADATLVAAAEKLGLKRVFTLDSDFDVYRFRGRQHFERIPGDPGTH